ncbi:MAG TPA: phosphatase PAP2 family protein [Dehalococcoidia bacterium]
MRSEDRANDGFDWRSLLPAFSRRDLLEGAIIAIAFLLYFWVRGAVVDRPEAAYRHALDLIDLQRSLGFFWEDDLNAWIADRKFLAQLMNIIYFYLHFPLIIAFGLWLYYYRRHQYTFVRDSFLASGAIALVIYWLYPVAPPRELPELASRFDAAAPEYVLGFFDTMKAYLGYAYDTQSTRAFVNPYAAMPSLHFGWDLLLGLAVIAAFRRTPFFWPAAAIGVALPVLQIFSITTTANHYLIDAAAGGVVAIAGLGVALALRRWGYPWLVEQVRRLPWQSARRLLLGDAA